MQASHSSLFRLKRCPLGCEFGTENRFEPWALVYILQRFKTFVIGLTIFLINVIIPRLHLPRSSYDFSVCDFPYDSLDIVGDRGLRRLCLQFIWASYDFLICLF